MSGIISYTALGGKSGVMGGIPAFMAHGTGNDYESGMNSLSDNQTLQFSGAEINVGGHYSTTTWRFTAPVTGYYVFHWNISFQDVDKDGVDWVELDTTSGFGRATTYFDMRDMKGFDQDPTYWGFDAATGINLLSGESAGMKYQNQGGDVPGYMRSESWFSGHIVSTYI